MPVDCRKEASGGAAAPDRVENGEVDEGRPQRDGDRRNAGGTRHEIPGEVKRQKEYRAKWILLLTEQAVDGYAKQCGSQNVENEEGPKYPLHIRPYSIALGL